jgi:ATP adenylyltransferase
LLAVASYGDWVYNRGAMSHLWTPWRMAYLRGEEPLPEGCLFCLKPHEEDAQAHIVHRGQLCFVVLNRFPYNNGHLMVVPYAHVSTLEDLDAETLADLMALTQLSLRVLREAYRPQGFNVGMNIGGVAGAGVVGHVHLHIVPRWAGDTNAMTVVGETRVIPEWLHQTYERLRPLFERMSAQEQMDDRQ